MARPKQYADDAARQAAHRARAKAEWVEVRRAEHDALTTRLDALQAAVQDAAAHGHDLAQECRAGSVDTMLDNLVAAFKRRAA